jgi:prolyl oligopeptidase
MAFHAGIIEPRLTRQTPMTPPRYPPARRDTLVETIHGVAVADPFRWLEDDRSAETAAWSTAENEFTRHHLDGPARDTLLARLRTLYDYPRTLSLVGRGGRYFYTHNPGRLDQPILYVRDGIDGEPRVLLDPNRLSEDRTTALTAYAVSPDGRQVAYALSIHGSDRQLVRVLGREDLLQWVKFASIAWTADGDGFYYLRFPEPGRVAREDEQYFGRIYFHRLGDGQAQDALVFAHPVREVVPAVHVTSTGRWVVITAERGASDDSEVFVVQAHDPAAEVRRPRPLFQGFDAAYQFIEEANGLLYFRTTKDAPLGRIVAVEPDQPRVLREIVPEGTDRLSLAVMARDRLFAAYLRDASDTLRAFALDGTPAGEIPLPGIGSLVTLDAEPHDDEARFVFTSFVDPPGGWIWRDDAIRPLVASRPGAGDAGRYRTTQVWYPSKDGTAISMFLVHRAGVAPDGQRPVLLSGYGGFNISRTPGYDPGNFPLLEAGGVFALANLRGGGEYGEAWHRAGMLEHKQNVFDDFIAAAEYLVAQGWTTPSRIGIEGGSNGGLLVAAAMLQRPDLFGAVVCRVPVADMLRYHLFTVGRFWMPEYGSAEDPAQFRYLLAYSPYHNVASGVRYPPALIMTADTDDRVAPGMARKFAARLQAEGEGGPFLIRIETRAGHGAGKPIGKVIEEDADILTFVLNAIASPR